jgi:hypothetical protein
MRELSRLRSCAASYLPDPREHGAAIREVFQDCQQLREIDLMETKKYLDECGDVFGDFLILNMYTTYWTKNLSWFCNHHNCRMIKAGRECRLRRYLH